MLSNSRCRRLDNRVNLGLNRLPVVIGIDTVRGLHRQFVHSPQDIRGVGQRAVGRLNQRDGIRGVPVRLIPTRDLSKHR